MFFDPALGALLPVVVGAIIGFVPTFLLERRRERHLLRTRWDHALYESSVELVSAARTVQHLAERIDRTDIGALREQLDEEHRRLLCPTHQIWLGPPVRAHRSAQYDVRDLPDILHAQRRHHRLARRHGHQTAADAFAEAAHITALWARHGLHDDRRKPLIRAFSATTR